MGYYFSEIPEPKEPVTVAICPICNSEIYSYMDYTEDTKGRLVHCGEDSCK